MDLMDYAFQNRKGFGTVMRRKFATKNKQYAVIGLGRFGENLCRELTQMGHNVLAIDIDVERVHNASDFATRAVRADSMDPGELKALGVHNYDAVIVAIGDNVGSNILTTIVLKEMGVRKVISQAHNDMHGRVLEKIGTDIVIFPERDMAVKLARSLVSQNFLEQIQLSPLFSIIELLTPRSFINKNLMENGVRERLNVTVLAIRRKEEIMVSPGPDVILRQNDILVALGRNEDLEKLSVVV